MPSSATNNSISAETAAFLRLEELRAETSRNNKEAVEKQKKIEELKALQQENTIFEGCMKSNTNCWQDLQKNNTTALDKVVETTNHVVKANGEGLDKIIGGNEKIHQTIKQCRRTLGGTKAVFVADDEPTANGDIPGWIGHSRAEGENGEDDDVSLLTDPCVVETEEEDRRLVLSSQ